MPLANVSRWFVAAVVSTGVMGGVGSTTSSSTSALSSETTLASSALFATVIPTHNLFASC